MTKIIQSKINNQQLYCFKLLLEKEEIKYFFKLENIQEVPNVFMFDHILTITVQLCSHSN